MSKLEKYRGVFPAFYACYDADGNVSPERTGAFARYLLGKGVKGLYLTGSSGECIYQTVEERKLAMKAVVEAVKGKMTLIGHVAANSTKDSIDLAKYAKELDLDAIAAIPPIYFSLPDHAIAAYWRSMIEAAGLDFFIYNIPQTTGYSISTSLFKHMMANPKVIGIKNTSMPVQDILRFKLEAGKEIIVFNGPDEQYVGGRIMGADGGIGGTYGLMPELFLKAEEYMRASKIKEAQSIQKDITAIIYHLASGRGSLYSAIKEILRREGMDIGQVREPMPRITEGDLKLIDEGQKMIATAKQKYGLVAV